MSLLNEAKNVFMSSNVEFLLFFFNFPAFFVSVVDKASLFFNVVVVVLVRLS